MIHKYSTESVKGAVVRVGFSEGIDDLINRIPTKGGWSRPFVKRRGRYVAHSTTDRPLLISVEKSSKGKYDFAAVDIHGVCSPSTPSIYLRGILTDSSIEECDSKRESHEKTFESWGRIERMQEVE